MLEPAPNGPEQIVPALSRLAAVRSGEGWSLTNTSQFAGTPGVHDLGASLGVTTRSLWLVILRAAERWVPDGNTLAGDTVIVCREGRALVELADGSTHILNDETTLVPVPGRFAAIVNVGVQVAEVLVISPGTR